jgi:hypothetical protein
VVSGILSGIVVGYRLVRVGSRGAYIKQVSCRQPAELKVGRRVNKARTVVAARASLRAVLLLLPIRVYERVGTS